MKFKNFGSLFDRFTEEVEVVTSVLQYKSNTAHNRAVILQERGDELFANEYRQLRASVNAGVKYMDFIRGELNNIIEKYKIQHDVMQRAEPVILKRVIATKEPLCRKCLKTKLVDDPYRVERVGEEDEKLLFYNILDKWAIALRTLIGRVQWYVDTIEPFEKKKEAVITRVLMQKIVAYLFTTRECVVKIAVEQHEHAQDPIDPFEYEVQYYGKRIERVAGGLYLKNYRNICRKCKKNLIDFQINTAGI